jgi:class 3 adenylate cyclase
VDLDALLTEHRHFVTHLAAAHDGHIVKPEGDGFWVVFPSVTAGALAAMRMQEELRLAQPGKGDDRLAMRIVLTLGDVLHQEGALVGDAVVLATRIEERTPLDAIYLSAAAWLAVNQAEVRTAFVDTFTLKGFPEPVSVYRIEQTHRTRVITGQYIVITDLHGFSAVAEGSSMTVVEQILDQLLEVVSGVCREFGGTNRVGEADAYCLTFPDPGLTLAAVERLAEEWGAFERREGLRCPMNVAVHKGVLYAFRSYLYSRDLAVAVAVESATSRLPPGAFSIFVTERVRQDLAGTPWGSGSSWSTSSRPLHGLPRSRSTALGKRWWARMNHIPGRADRVRAEQPPAADALQPPLRSGFRARLRRSVGRLRAAWTNAEVI